MAYEFIIFLFIFLSPLTSLFDFFSLSLLRICLSLPTRILPLLTIERKQEGSAEEGDGDGQERRKGSHDFIEIGSVRFAEWSGEVGEWG